MKVSINSAITKGTKIWRQKDKKEEEPRKKKSHQQTKSKPKGKKNMVEKKKNTIYEKYLQHIQILRQHIKEKMTDDMRRKGNEKVKGQDAGRKRKKYLVKYQEFVMSKGCEG